MSRDKRFVYVLRNADQNPHFYVGLTCDVNARWRTTTLGAAHTQPLAARGSFTWSSSSPNQQRALRFERYLKSGSGRAFAKRHFES